MPQFALKLSNLRRKLEYVGPVLPSHFRVIVDLLVRGFALRLRRVDFSTDRPQLEIDIHTAA